MMPRNGCGCASCVANRGWQDGSESRHTGSDGGLHHGNPYDVLRLRNQNRHDPLTAREEARARVAAEQAALDGAPPGSREALARLRRRSPGGSNLSGAEARQIVRITEFRPEWL